MAQRFWIAAENNHKKETFSLFIAPDHRQQLYCSGTYFVITRQSKLFLTWALISLRMALGCGTPGVSSSLPSLGALWVGRPVVVGAPRGVRVPHRPWIITVTCLEETRERKCEGWKRQRKGGEGEESLFNETLTGVLKQHAPSNTRCGPGLEQGICGVKMSQFDRDSVVCKGCFTHAVTAVIQITQNWVFKGKHMLTNKHYHPKAQTDHFIYSTCNCMPCLQSRHTV